MDLTYKCCFQIQYIFVYIGSLHSFTLPLFVVYLSPLRYFLCLSLPPLLLLCLSWHPSLPLLLSLLRLSSSLLTSFAPPVFLLAPHPSPSALPPSPLFVSLYLFCSSCKPPGTTLFPLCSPPFPFCSPSCTSLCLSLPLLLFL